MKKPLSVYVHLPFCEQRCGYCDFLSCCDLGQIDAYLERLLTEIKNFDFAPYVVQTIYLGGGTPSILSVAQLQTLLAALPTGAKEITIECNPNSLTEEKCQAYKAMGINRVSIGVQSFDDATLRDLGRIHDVKQAVAAITLAHKYFANVSIDLIKDIPQHQFILPPAHILALIQHLSVYSLTKNDQCVLETNEPVILPSDFQQYEISNYARPGFVCRHNLVYWTGGEYIGFGAGAHSLMRQTRFCNSDDILHYQRLSGEPRTPEMVRREKIMLGLRLSTGVPANLLKHTAKATALIEQGLLQRCGSNLVATASGQLLLNQIWLQLVE